ncbi:MAG: hypothetical protein IPL84_01850 [Chitinophagaceae bacterium]|nr:hypothetical protein [Chitinophagaceae bacterium]
MEPTIEEKKEDIKALLLCCSRFAFPVIQQLAYFGQLGAVLIPDHCPEIIEEIREMLKATDIPVIESSKTAFEEKACSAIEQYQVNLGLVLTFSFMIPRTVFSLPAKGFFNVHPGPLPAYRGADPIFHQVKNREKYAGLAIHKVDAGADSGDIVLQEKIPLHTDDTYGILSEKLAVLAVKLTGTLIHILSMGFAAPSKPQDESKAHYYPKQSNEELTIDWLTQDAASIIALINACNPHNKGAATKINTKLIRLLQAENIPYDNVEPVPPGTILYLDDEYMDIAVTGGQRLRVKFIYIEEGFLPPAALKQFGLAPGIIFENIYQGKNE